MAKRTSNRRPYYPQNVEHIKNKKLKQRLQVDAYRGGIYHEDLRALRRTLAKTANQRMVRLERAESAVTGEKYSEFGAIEIAKEYLGDRHRFSEQLNYGDIAQVRRDIYALQTFLASKSSTVAGQKAIEKKRIETFSSGKWGTGNHSAIADASNKQFYDFLNSKVFSELSGLFTSEQIIEYYDALRTGNTSHKEVMQKFEEAYASFQNKESAVNLKNLAGMIGTKPLKE